MIGWRNAWVIAGVSVLIGACSSAAAQAPLDGPDARIDATADLGTAASPDATFPLPQLAQEAPPFIEVSGRGQVTVSPDLARLHFTVETEGESANESSTSNAELMMAVLAALRGVGVEGLRIETFGYNLQPLYARSDGNRVRRISGYRAFNNVRVTSPDTEAVGTLIDAALGGGANRIASLSFDAEDTGDARQEALTLAVANARAQAEAIASAMGVPLGAPIEVRGGAQAPVVGPQQGMMMRAEAAATPIEAADRTVSATVTIKYRLGGER